MSEPLALDLAWHHQLRLHIVAHLHFYRRNRLLLGLVLVTAVLLALPLLPAMLETTGKRFDLLKQMASQLDWMVWVSAAGLGLFAASSHLRDRSAKLIFTRPGRPDIWLLSIFVSAFLVALAAQFVAASLTLVLSLAWGVPYQVGFLYLTINTLLQTLIIIAFLTTMGVAVHPLIAVLFVAFFNERSLYGVEFMFNLAQASYTDASWPMLGRWTIHGIRCVVPTLTPFSAEMDGVHSSLHVGARDWQYLAAAGGYALLVSVFLFFLSAWSLRRRSLV